MKKETYITLNEADLQRIVKEYVLKEYKEKVKSITFTRVQESYNLIGTKAIVKV
jgi:hypothetical protein